MATIKPIEARTIHQIQSGQVIVDLCSVVKELVENSLDAGATNIEVRFKNQGLDAIEVQDNGSGISKENYDTLALKHYTSKLSTYSDLESLETFGFRGEALSSLCALSKFSVTTCLASDAPKGSRLEFETSGKLRSTSVVAVQKGTTVLVERLFHNLPVRRRELERNIKREWNKVLSVLNQYACIQTGLKFSVSQQPNKGKRMILFSTKGNQTTRENIVNVFGAKTLAVLIPLDLVLELEPTNTSTQRLTTRGGNESKLIRVRGHVSRPAHGEGRQTPDRQMFFVNGRPCGLPQFAKVFNEVYKSYNASQSPFIFADIQLDTHLYDVNVSPDKRSILLHDQTRMLDSLRESLSTLFESQDYALPTSQLQGLKQPVLKRPSPSRQDTSSEAGTKRLDASDAAFPKEPTPTNTEPRAEGEGAQIANDEIEPAVSGNSLIDRWAGRNCDLREDIGLKDNGITKRLSEGNNVPKKDSQHIFSPNIRQEEPPSNEELARIPDHVTDFRTRLEELKDGKDDETTDKSTLPTNALSEPAIPALSPPPRLTSTNSSKCPSSTAKRTAPEVATITIGDHTVTSIIGPASKKQRLDSQQTRNLPTRKGIKELVLGPSFNGRLTQMFAAQAERSTSEKGGIMTTTTTRDDSQHSDSSSEHLFVTDDSEEESDIECRVDAPVGDEDQTHSPQGSQESKETTEENSGFDPTSPTNHHDPEYESGEFRGEKEEGNADEKIGNAQISGEIVSDESQKRTQSFIKGQFNLGFILASRAAEERSAGSANRNVRDDELFIIDQHATDEKYNFERLQASTVVQSQRLVHPKMLELTAVEEDIVQQNLDALETNGFMVSFDDSGEQPVGTRCQLLSLPLSRETTFSLADLEELISLLQDHQSASANTVPRPSKVRKMFAMRACRSSVMIGKSLSIKQMEKLVRHMGELDKPWNCPHGRPTMRHLCGLGAWDELGWKEGDGFNGGRGPPTDWRAYLNSEMDLE
ncbi:hypothetical protein NUW58_g2025 [Xylaria curta]|uniref:Uncharacterized protein n=1 Tax=Xylaria curta TaxID=42375 RepID=A0ACC1PKD9_9PEZI|nr:hypothetical protein NUW58_g2025 [Xylaria curta]